MCVCSKQPPLHRDVVKLCSFYTVKSMYPMCNTLRLVSRYYYFYYSGYTAHDLNNNSNHTECVATNTELCVGSITCRTYLHDRMQAGKIWYDRNRSVDKSVAQPGILQCLFVLIANFGTFFVGKSVCKSLLSGLKLMCSPHDHSTPCSAASRVFLVEWSCFLAEQIITPSH